ncbi:MAG: RNA 2',3'-cyclic phosphodiesterase [Candidatus Staskawiczbacteria bacterium]|jgi:2'-5' RNA ligase
MEKRHRVFIAINLPEEIKKELLSFSQKWPELPARWLGKDTLHITLEFLGDLTDVEIADACQIVKDVAKRHNSFSVTINKVSYGAKTLTGRAPGKMIWAEGEKSGELADLKNDLQESLLEKISFRPESREFHPHITLARIREMEFRNFDLEEVPEVNEAVDLVFTVESIEVMESELKRGGPVYTTLESHVLGE